jgi:hypothetical protein
MVSIIECFQRKYHGINDKEICDVIKKTSVFNIGICESGCIQVKVWW